MKIGLDIDGVLIDFERTMRTCAELYDLLILNKNGVKNQEEFDYLKRYDWTDIEKNNFIKNYLVYATENLTPFVPLAKEMLELFKAENISFQFITARGLLTKETKAAIIKLFEANEIPTDCIYFGVKDKPSKCIKLGIDIMIEDNPTICEELVDSKIKTLYFRDKNSKKLKENDYLIEVSNIGEICRNIFANLDLKNSKDTYEKILFRNKKY